MYLAQSQNVFTDYNDCKSKGRKYTCSTPHVDLLLTNHWGRGEEEGYVLVYHKPKSIQKSSVRNTAWRLNFKMQY